MEKILANIYEEKRKKELNLYSKALNRLQRENIIFKQAECRYSEFVHNQHWRSWVGINYNKLIEKIIQNKDIKNFEIKNYDDKRVFDELEKTDNHTLRSFSVSKEIFEYIEPNNIEDLANVLALGKGNIGGYILNLAQKGGFQSKILKRITKKTHNLILFEEQLKKTLNKIFQDKDEASFIFKIFYDVRYSCDLREILKLCRKSNFSILDYIKKENIIGYTNHLKIAYTALKDTLGEIDTGEFNNLLNNILLGVMISCKKSEAVKTAKNLYKFIAITNDLYE